MGLGKTLTMISLILKSLIDEDEDSFYEDNDENDVESKAKYLGGTLIICPASLLNHWDQEIRNKLKSGKLSVELFHGANREFKAKRCKMKV